MATATYLPTASSQVPVAAWAAGVALLIGAVMISGDSLWIDELQTNKIASIDGFADAVRAVVASPESEAQMPGYILYAWLWEKLAGGGEWALRLSNLPWLLLAVGSLARVGSALNVRLLVPLFLVQPFVWAYADEFRPYAMQLAGGALSLWALVHLTVDRGRGARWAIELTAAAAILCVASMLGAITTALIYFAAVLLTWRHGWRLERSAVAVVAMGSVLLAALGVYYAWTLLGGAGGAKLWNVGVANIAMAGYEFLGFCGLGPGRDAMRDAARGGGRELAQLFRPYLVTLAALAACYTLLAAIEVKSVWRRRHASSPLAWMAVAVVIGNLLGLFALAIVAKWPFWGRHLAPAFPYFMLCIALAASDAWRRTAGRAIVVCLMAALLASSLSLRFASVHRHDDYRGAAAELTAALADGDRVWWVARDLADSDLYGASFRDGAPAQLTRLFSPDAEELAVAATTSPDLIIMSKQDIFDSHGTVIAYIQQHDYKSAGQLKAFQMWRRGE